MNRVQRHRLTGRDGHPDWCAGGHRCNLGEHRAEPVTLCAPNRGVMILTRVRAADGTQHVEIRTRITLAAGEMQARAHLARILSQLDALLRLLVRLPR
jgi:ABC-type hemin transport system ATPase subunit